MVAKSKATAGKGHVKKLKLKRETLKDLETGRHARNVKGGVIIELGADSAVAMACISVLVCPDPPRKPKR